MRQKRVLLDCDEVLCDFCTPALAFMLERFGFQMELSTLGRQQWDILLGMTQEQREIFEVEFFGEGRCGSLKPFVGAVEAVVELRKHAEVVVVTRPPRHARHWVHERTQWLVEWFGFEYDAIVHTGAKHVVFGDVLVDDNPENVIKWQSYHPQGVGLLWARPNTDGIAACDGCRVGGWDEVLKRVKAL